ncbi:hypothetical protein PR202_gb14362 [Eleusine coracana subsp. coracana]|uniref:NAC domain-containing protein n=1 Tax=Eleusine coracana subsp. coracana TaxID=191504 RepID=A0AAV5EV95_ELECO|nr:hypothetical protein PR202_gb14362 [Eleusine coracana subsp. coracana]
MSSISMVESRLPPGFRFHPRDDELVLDYLCRKLSGGAYGGINMVDVDLNKCEPWDLPGGVRGRSEWYFFSLHDRKYATGQRTNRATRSGYWKATGKDRTIISRRRGVVGMRKTLVFYQGRAPRGSKTEWVMHEFRVEGPAVADAVAGRPSSPLKEDWVLCRVFYRSRTVTTRPAAIESGSLSNELIGLPMPMPPVDAAYLLAFDHAPAAATMGGFYYQQDDADDGLPAAAQVKSMSSFRELLTSMVERDGAAVAKAELHQDWTEAAYAQQSAQTWNPFLSSG